MKSQLDPIASTTKGLTIFGALLVTFVVGVIFWIIAASNVKRQRLRLGIMKGLGYSSKDLMLQMTLRTLPVTVVGVGIAAILATKVNEIFWKTSFSLIVSSKIWLVIVEGLALIAFSFVATYLGTGKIKKISVTELMTE